MMRIYEVKTENPSGQPYSRYNVAAQTFDQAVAKVQKKEIGPHKKDDGRYLERIAEVRILASED